MLLKELTISINKLLDFQKARCGETQKPKTQLVRVTADVYAHVSNKLETEAIDKYEEYIKNVID